MATAKPFPKSMSACADLLYDLRTERLEADKVAAALLEREKALKEHIINNLSKDSSGAMGKHHKVKVEPKVILQVDDWPAFHAYVSKTKAWDMLQKRISDKAVSDRIADGKKVPGVVEFHTKTVSLTKV